MKVVIHQSGEKNSYPIYDILSEDEADPDLPRVEVLRGFYNRCIQIESAWLAMQSELEKLYVDPEDGEWG